MKAWTSLLILGLAEGANVDFGWITPSNTVENSACFNASQRYIAAFGDADDPSKNMTWGPLMMDADGRLPMEGFLSDTIPILISLCDSLHGTALASCNKLPSSLTNLLIHFPFGFHHNPGNMDLCLEGAHTKLGVETKYCTVYMVTPDIGIGGMEPPPRRKDQSYVNRYEFQLILFYPRPPKLLSFPDFCNVHWHMGFGSDESSQHWNVLSSRVLHWRH